MRATLPLLPLVAVASFAGACLPLEAHLSDVAPDVVAPADADDPRPADVPQADRSPGLLIVDDDPAPVWDDPWRDPWADSRVGIEVFHDRHELDELEFDEDLETLFGDGIGDVERERVGVRVTFGTSDIRAFAQVFGEEIDDFDTSELRPGTSVRVDDLWGVGLGLMGEPVIGWLGAAVAVRLVYRADASVVSGEGIFTDSDPLTALRAPRVKEDLGYFDHHLLAGVGLDLLGWRPTLGFTANYIAGGVDEDLVTLNAVDDLYFEAFNAGLFGELVYEPRDGHFRIGARGTVGDIEGLELFVGGRF